MDQEQNTTSTASAPTVAAPTPTVQYPIRVEVDYPQHSSRLLAIATLLFLIPKAAILIPHFIILYVLGLASFVAFVLAQFAVLFTGKYPRGIFDFVVGVTRWQTRMNGYFLGLTDSYPPFSTH